MVGPALLDVPLSFMHYDMIAATGRWVGLDNYRALSADSIFWEAVAHTLELAVGTAVPLLRERARTSYRVRSRRSSRPV